MLLFVILSTAALFSPILSQPTRTDLFEESDYPLPVFRDRNDWGEALDRPYKGIGFPTYAEKFLTMGVPSGKNYDLDTNQKFARETETKESPQNRLTRRQFHIDPIGGGYLLRRDTASGTENPEKKSFPLDPIGGGYLLKRRNLNGQYNSDSSRLVFADRRKSDSEKPRRFTKSDLSIRLIPKDDVVATLATGDSLLNKDRHLRLEAFPIDPIGGGLLLGRSVGYENLKSLVGKQEMGVGKDDRSPSGNYLAH